MRHIHYGIRLDTVGMMTGDKALQLIDAIHHESLLLESFFHIRSRTHKTGKQDGRNTFFI